MLRFTTLALLASAAPVFAAPVFAADINAVSKIDGVVVYPGVASVTRLIEVAVPAGTHTLVVTGLPQSLNPNSLRVEGTASGQLQIGSVEMRTQPFVGVAAPTGEVAMRLKKLQDDRERKTTELEALTAKRTIITAIGEQAPSMLIGKDKPADPADWSKAWDAVGQGLAKVGEELRNATAALREINEDIAAIGRQNRGPERAGITRDANISVESANGAKVTLKLTYQVSGVSWRPSYDAVLTTGTATVKPKLVLVRRAMVSQRTGEDWNDVTLSVSTAQARGGTQVPDLAPVRVGFNEPSAIVQNSSPLRTRATAPAISEAMKSVDDNALAQASGGLSTLAAPQPAPAPVVQQQAQLEASGFSAQFIVAGRVTITPDGSTRAFRIGARDIEPTLGIKTAPGLDAKAYLEARFSNDEDAPLLAGEVALTRDGVFVGQGRIRQIASGDTVDMGFGVDDKVKVARVPVRRRETEASWSQGQRGDLREFKTTVKNLHDRTMKITVLDQIPYSENNTIVVEAIPTMTPATEKTVQDKRGVMGWTYDYKPGEEKELRNGFRMRWPNDRELVLELQPLAR